MKKNDIYIQEPLDENIFLRAFLKDLYLRPSCHKCPHKNFRSGSDITLADAWGIQNYSTELEDDDKGLSLIIPFTEKGKRLLLDINSYISISRVDNSIIRMHNSAAYTSAKPHKNRKKFFNILNNGNANFQYIIKKCLPPSTFFDKILWSINKRLQLLKSLI
jgi:hypothetical protein